MSSTSAVAAQVRRSRTSGDARPARRDIPDTVRVLFSAVTLAALWNHVWFPDLSDRTLLAGAGGNLFNQVVFLSLGAGMLAALHRLGFERLRPLASRPLLALGGWLALTTAISTDPLLSIRRLVLFVIVALLSAGLLVLARSGRQFALSLALACGAIVAASYAGVALVPDLAVHTAFDVTDEYNNIGFWRGIFAHKNEAGGAMAAVAVCGLYVASVRSRTVGFALAAAAAVFMIMAGSKTQFVVLPTVLLITTLCRHFRGAAMRALLLLGPIAVLAVATIGSVLFPPVRSLLQTLPFDATFTARADIWQFAIENILVHPVKGWGYGAFWMTDYVQYGSVAQETWVQTATQAHNAFLDAALAMGLPGLALVVAAFFVAPVRDLRRACGHADLDPLMRLFLRLWLLAAFSANIENVLLNANGSLCALSMIAVFGIRMRTRHAVVAG